MCLVKLTTLNHNISCWDEVEEEDHVMFVINGCRDRQHHQLLSSMNDVIIDIVRTRLGFPFCRFDLFGLGRDHINTTLLWLLGRLAIVPPYSFWMTPWRIAVVPPDSSRPTFTRLTLRWRLGTFAGCMHVAFRSDSIIIVEIIKN